MRAPLTRPLACALFAASAGCGGTDPRPPIVAPPPAASAASAPSASACPAGSERRTPSLCEATEPLVPENASPVKVRLDCADFYGGTALKLEADESPEAPFPAPRASFHATETCGAGKKVIELDVLPGAYTLTVNTTAAKYFVTGREPVADIYRYRELRDGPRRLPIGFASAGDVMHYGDDDDAHRMGFARPSATVRSDGDFVEIVVAQLGPGATAIDLLALENEGELLAPEVPTPAPIGATRSAIGAADGDVVVIPAGRQIRLRYRTRVREKSSYLPFLVRAQVLAPGESPQLEGVVAGRAEDVRLDECPRGAVVDRDGCVATEPVVTGNEPPVRVTFSCSRYPASVVPAERVPTPRTPADVSRLIAEATAEHGKGHAAFIQCGSPVDVDLAPGAYVVLPSVVSASQFLTQRSWLYVHPSTPATEKLDQEQTTHCPRISSLDASRGEYLAASEIFSGASAKSKRAVYLGGDRVVASKGIITLRITEVEHEEAFIDMLRIDWKGHTLVPLDGGARSVLADVDGRVLRLAENRQVHVTYRLPEPVTGEVFVRVLGFGHYERRDAR
jgi:hypothetical protein